ncbi:MAG: response regulator transcription factor [Gemmatimonadales bacterium]
MASGQLNQRGAPISLVLIEDNRLLREGIVALIRAQPDFAVVAAPARVGPALKQIRKVRPQVVLLDCGLVNDDSVQVTATLHAELPEVKIVGMGLLPVPEDVTDLVRAGASGFVMKNSPIADILTTIRSVVQGVDVMPAQLTLSAIAQSALEVARSGSAALLEATRPNRRELQVLALAGDGLSNRDIATRLRVPVYTVRSHLQNLMEKLTLRIRLEPEGPTLGQVRHRGVVPSS